MHYTSPAHPQEKKQEYQIDYLQRLVHVNVKIHPMHDTSPAHPQRKKQKYQIDYLHKLVCI